MKTFFFYTLLIILSLPANSQDLKSTFDDIVVVTTTAGTAPQLSWKKGNEQIAFFIIERSSDGHNFKQCAIVLLSDDPAFTSYKFRDTTHGLSKDIVYRVGLVNDAKKIFYLPAKKLLYPASL